MKILFFQLQTKILVPDIDKFSIAGRKNHLKPFLCFVDTS